MDEKIYVGVDGSMLLTRDAGWKEVKVCRIFTETAYHDIEPKRNYLDDSQYIAHLGGHKEFEEKVETLLDSYKETCSVKNVQLVFLSDGATWIKNWIEDAYPKAHLILDYYHATEYLAKAKNLYFFSENDESKMWLEKMKTFLYEGQVMEVINELQNLQKKKRKNKKKLGQILNYFLDNKDRMKYDEYRKMGLGIIASGSIESTHRTLLQERMKLSGQRWSIKGLQNMIDLKTTYLNKQWTTFIDFSG
jgi:hypothetical protein